MPTHHFYYALYNHLVEDYGIDGIKSILGISLKERIDHSDISGAAKELISKCKSHGKIGKLFARLQENRQDSPRFKRINQIISNTEGIILVSIAHDVFTNNPDFFKSYTFLKDSYKKNIKYIDGFSRSQDTDEYYIILEELMDQCSAHIVILSYPTQYLTSIMINVEHPYSIPHYCAYYWDLPTYFILPIGTEMTWRTMINTMVNSSDEKWPYAAYCCYANITDLNTIIQNKIFSVTRKPYLLFGPSTEGQPSAESGDIDSGTSERQAPSDISNGNVQRKTLSNNIHKGGVKMDPISTKWRKCLEKLDDSELNAFCEDHYPKVSDRFSQGMQRNEKITHLLAYCRRNDEWDALSNLCESPKDPPKEDEHPTPQPELQEKLKILFLASNPRGTTQLNLDIEIRSITEKIRASKYRDAIELESRWAVRPDDLLQALNEIHPQIVHFSGHGNKIGELILEDQHGLLKPVGVRALQQLFATLKDDIQIVFLNNCFSIKQAESISIIIDCVVSMRTRISDGAAITFSASFYRAIGFGRTVQDAFDQGLAALALEGIPEDDVPQLLVRPGIDPKSIILVKANP